MLDIALQVTNNYYYGVAISYFSDRLTCSLALWLASYLVL